jgi:hypothetical protein
VTVASHVIAEMNPFPMAMSQAIYPFPVKGLTAEPLTRTSPTGGERIPSTDLCHRERAVWRGQPRSGS